MYQIVQAAVRQAAAVEGDPPLCGMNVDSSLDMCHLDFLTLKKVGKLVPDTHR